MSKAVKRILAIFLAALLTLALSTAAAAAPAKPMKRLEGAPVLEQAAPNWTMSITTQPTDTSFVMHVGEPNLAGMVISVSGGIFTTPASIAYNTVWDDDVQKQDKILWDFYVWPNEDRWVVGNNAATLSVYAWKCTEFHPLFTENEIEYGYFDTEHVFYADAPITVVATPFDLGGITKPLGSAPVIMPFIADYYNNEVFEFIAPSDGYYSFKSTGGQYGGTFYSVDGDVIEQDYVDPWAELYDKDGYFLAWDDDRGGNYNFAIYQQLKAGDKVYLVVGGWASENKNVTITAARVGDKQPVLALKSNDITLTFHEVLSFDDLLKDTGLKAGDVFLDYDWEYINGGWWFDGLYGVKRGTTALTIEAPDGSAAKVNVTIKYSAMQWLCVILLGGWAWMPFTGVGPFNLWGEIKNLFDYGIINSLFDLFFHWRYGLFVRLIASLF